MGIGLVLLSDKFVLYKELAAAGPLTSVELSSRTGTAARYLREWAAAQAAGGHINFDSATERFSISPEQALILADENGPALFPPMFEIAAAAALPNVRPMFRQRRRGLGSVPALSWIWRRRGHVIDCARHTVDDARRLALRSCTR